MDNLTDFDVIFGRDGLHPVQERLANAHGSQCGFCTPGIVMSMYTLLRNKSLPAMGDIKTSLQVRLINFVSMHLVRGRVISSNTYFDLSGKPL